MMIRDKNNIFERVENFHADLAWNYPNVCFSYNLTLVYLRRGQGSTKTFFVRFKVCDF